jgi:hypothetical protein
MSCGPKALEICASVRHGERLSECRSQFYPLILDWGLSSDVNLCVDDRARKGHPLNSRDLVSGGSRP